MSTTPVPAFPVGITLGAFSRIMHVPAPWFQGIKLADGNTCDPLTGDGRDMIAHATQTALGMMEARLQVRGASLYERERLLTSQAPYFTLRNQTAYTLASASYTVNLAPPSSLEAPVTLTVTLSPLGTGEAFYRAAVFIPGTRRRLGVELLSASESSGTLTLTARADNFVDLDTIGNSAAPVDAVPYVTSCTVMVWTKTPSLPAAYWVPLTTCANSEVGACDWVDTEGCLREEGSGVWSVRDYNPDCFTGRLHHFGLSVLEAGKWSTTLEDALVSLTNCRLPQDYCACSPLASSRYRDDNGLSERYAKVYPYSFNNGFGILTPGAQYAWKAIEAALNDTAVFRG